MSLIYRPARPDDIAACIVLRGQTRENAVSAERLAQLGITESSWSAQVAADELPGVIASSGDRLLGYCFGDARNGEIVVLALLPEAEGQGLGRALLAQTCAVLQARGHRRLFLGCSANPAHRSHGFYRHLGWRPTGERDGLGDEVLEWLAPR